MGNYSEYLDRKFSFPDLTAERKKQLSHISQLRGGNDILVYAADLNMGEAPTMIDYSDLLPLIDQLDNLDGKNLDFILETPGGLGEVAEDIVRILREKYETVSIIVPGWAKSAGTIITMSADEILMGSMSALGPIDAQLRWQGKSFSAHALLEGFDKIKVEVEKSGTLNKTYIPILQGISPGELQQAQNSLNFAKDLVTDWLAKFKFRNWKTHSSTGSPVTEDQKKVRAEEIASQLCDHGRWLSHGKSIKIHDLEAMGLKITNYSSNTNLSDAIQRYYALLQISFATNIYKLFETPVSQIYRFATPNAPNVPMVQPTPDVAILESECSNCKNTIKLQANFGKKSPIEEGCIEFPQSSSIKCPKCSAEIDLTDVRRQLEMQTQKPIV